MLIVVALDDVSGDTTSYVIDKLLDKGAKNVHITQTVTKKGRIGLIFFIDVDEKNLDDVGEVIMTELGSTGYNVISAKHFQANTRLAVHRVIVRSKKESFDGAVRIKSSVSPKGKLVKVDPEYDDLVRIIEGVKKKLGVDLTLRRIKKKIQEEVSTGRDQTILEVRS